MTGGPWSLTPGSGWKAGYRWLVVLLRRHLSTGDAGHAIADEVSLRNSENRGWDNEVVWL